MNHLITTKTKFFRLVIAMTMILFVAFSCKKSEENFPPTITLLPGSGYVHSDTTLASGADIKLRVQMQKGDLNMTNFLIDVNTDSVSRYFDTGMNIEYLVWEGAFIKTLAPIEDWIFMVIDREGNATATSIKISLDTSAQFTPLLSYSPFDFGAQDNQQVGGCYDISDSSMYFHAAVAADTSLQKGIDMLCFYDDIDKNTITSSGANIEDGIFPVNPSSWTYINTTRYYETSLSVDDYNAATSDSILLANYDEGEAKRKAKKLAIDDIYTFRTESGRLGIFKVNAVNGTNEGNINISLKIQQ
jgi:hypothetical protein